MNAIITDGPAWYAIALYKGDDAELPLVIDEGDAPTFTPVDITGSTFKMEIEKKRGGAAVLTLTTGGGGIPITDAANGAFKVIFSAANTVLLAIADPLQYDLQWTNAAGKVKTLLRGDLKVKKDITPA